MARQPSTPCQPSNQTPPSKKERAPYWICVVPSPGHLSDIPPSTNAPTKPQGPPCASTDLGGSGRGVSPLPGLKSLPEPSSLKKNSLRPSPSPATRHLQCNYKSYQGLQSYGGGGEWLGTSSYKRPSYIISVLLPGGEGYRTISGVSWGGTGSKNFALL